MFSTGLEVSVHLDKVLASQVEKLDDIESAVHLFQEAIILACKNSLKFVGKQRKQPSTIQFRGGK
jgi:hypothetical protein